MPSLRRSPIRLVSRAAAIILPLSLVAALFVAPAASAAARQSLHSLVIHPHATCSTAYLPLPDPACTPGATNPDVTQDTIDSTICVSGWTSTIRPPTSYTNKLKAQGIVDYGYSDTNMSDYEEDHFLPLEVGGAPSDPANLWPEPHYGTDNSYNKDAVENAVKRAVCAHQVTLADAQAAMLNDWTTAESVLGI